MSRSILWTGRVISALPVLAMVFSAVIKFRAPPEVVQAFTGKYGYPAEVLTTIGVLEVSCVILYVIPQVAVLGAVLMTAYLGGAVATHVRASEAWFAPVIVAALAWLGLYLREPRLHELLPLRRLPETDSMPAAHPEAPR